MLNINHAAVAFLGALLEDVRRARNSSKLAQDQDLYIKLEEAITDVMNFLETRKDMSIVLITLPDLGKLFDKAMSSQFYDWNSHSKICKEARVPRSVTNLFAQIFDKVNGRHLFEIDAGLVFFIRQALYLFKKVNLDCPQESIERTVRDFIEMDQSLRAPSGTWNADYWLPHRFAFGGDPVLHGSHPRADALWKTVDDVFASIVPMREVDRLLVRPKHGPGAVADMKTGEDKYLFPHWPTKLEGQFPAHVFSQHRSDLHLSEETTSVLNPIEPPARLIAVPKTFKGPRLIASEPIAHQFLQQGLMKWLRDNLSPLLRDTINFTSQEESREAALKASRNGELATVDLSSASDRLSCWVVERAFGGNNSLLSCLHAVRTRTIIDGTGTDELLHLRMKKFAAQGSAVTFPVQTIVYAGLAIAAVLFYENLKPSKRNIRLVGRKVRVFGDDIMIPRNCVPLLTLMLDSLELKVNASKTHFSGLFRESCGMDAYNGVEVTPAYVSDLVWDKSPEKISSWVEVSNNFHKKGLWALSNYMQECIPPKYKRRFLVSSDSGDGFRLFTFCRGTSTQARVRFSNELHRTEARILALRSRVVKKSRGSWQDLYQYFIETPDPQSKWTTGYLTKNTSAIVEVWAPTD